MQKFDEHQKVVKTVVDGFVGAVKAVEDLEADLLETLLFGVAFLLGLVGVEFV